MKNRCISLLLLLSLLLSCLTLYSTAASDEAEAAVGFLQATPPTRIAAAAQSAAKRGPIYEIGQTSTIVAAPYLKGLAAKASSMMLMHFILRDSGAQGMHFCVDLYEGTSTAGKKLAAFTSAFPGEKGLYYTSAQLSTVGLEEGTYLVVMYSAETPNGTPISGTQSQEKVYIKLQEIPLQKFNAFDAESGAPVTSLQMSLIQQRIVELEQMPAINTTTKEFILDYDPAVVDIADCGGLLVVQPYDLGWTILRVRDRSNTYLELPIEVCVDPRGHVNEEVTYLHNVSAETEEVRVRYCSACGASCGETEDYLSLIGKKYVDLSSDSWYYDPVCWGIASELFAGVSQNRFDPNGVMTRAMLVAVMWRSAGGPEEGENPFMDVIEGSWYTEAVSWAAHNGVVEGVGNGLFQPHGHLTREQMITILYRYAKMNDWDLRPYPDVLEDFPDGNMVSAYAQEPMRWAVSEGILAGVQTNGKVLLSPAGNVTRAMVATILQRYLRALPRSADFVRPDVTDAVAHAEYGDMVWALYADGTLKIGGGRTLDSMAGIYDWRAFVKEITRLEILEGVETIGTETFKDHTALTEVVLPKSLKYIEESAFENCTSLKSVQLPNRLRQIGNGVFMSCTALEEMILPDSLYSFGENPLVGNALFAGCTSLKKVKLPAGWLQMPTALFEDCTSLTEVELPKNLQVIHKRAFQNCTALTELILPFGVRHIADEAFTGCTSLETLCITQPLADVFILMQATEDYKQPFGEVDVTTVYAYSGTYIEAVAKKYGYAFVALEDIIE